MLATRLKHELHTLLTAWIYFTRVPLPQVLAKKITFSQHSLEESARYLSAIGIVIGIVAGLVYWGALLAFDSQGLAVALSIVASIIATGAIHEDGLGDFFDGFGGGWYDKERILDIMKDSRVGIFGALALISALLVKFQALVALDVSALTFLCIMIAGHALSRTMAASFIFTHAYVRANDQSYFKPMLKDKMRLRDFAIMSLLGVLPVLLLGDWLFLLLIPAMWVVRSLFGRWFIRKIGGYTGDCLGATQQIVEICFYLGVLAIYRIIA